MQILLEYETEIQLNVPYDEIANKVISVAVEQYDFPENIEVSLTLVDNERIHVVNREFRDIDRPTDVLSFPTLSYEVPGQFLEEYADSDSYDMDTDCVLLGDIMISVEKVMEQAKEYGHSEEREFAFLVAHSMLHLFGFDHIIEAEREDMERRQEEILNTCGYTRD